MSIDGVDGIDRPVPVGKVLLIGASGGVGKCLVRQLLLRGYGVLASVRNQAAFERAMNNGLTEKNLFIAEFSDAEIGKSQVSETLARNNGPIAAVINCAAVNPCGPLETTPLAVYRQATEINAVANLAIYQAALPYLRESKGRFIFISSTSGAVAMPLLGYYTASKHALEGLVDTMRLEAGQWGVQVSLIQPGAIATDMVEGFGVQLDARFAELDEQGKENYGDYFAQHKALADGADGMTITPDEVATKIIEVLEAEAPEARYPMGLAVEFIAKRKSLSDHEMDAMINQFLPGSRYGF